MGLDNYAQYPEKFKASSIFGAGIGGGYMGNGGSFTITGGTVIATSGSGTPIGAGNCGTDNGEIVFKGGTVTTGIHEHTYSDTWSCNETHHWHDATCEHTDLVFGFSTVLKIHVICCLFSRVTESLQ